MPASLSGLAASLLVLSATIVQYILVLYIVPQSYILIGLQFIEEFIETSVAENESKFDSQDVGGRQKH
jgi:hypothetical protein